jgi:hypothetical protein
MSGRKAGFAGSLLLGDGLQRARKALRLPPGAPRERVLSVGGEPFKAAFEQAERELGKSKPDLAVLSKFLVEAELLERRGRDGPDGAPERHSG